MNRRSLKIILSCLLCFFAGGASGGVIMAEVMHTSFHHGLFQERLNFKERALTRLSKRLSLDSGQQKKMATLLDDLQTKLQLARDNERAHFSELIHQGLASSRQFLSSEQYQRLELMITEREQRIAAAPTSH